MVYVRNLIFLLDKMTSTQVKGRNVRGDEGDTGRQTLNVMIGVRLFALGGRVCSALPPSDHPTTRIDHNSVTAIWTLWAFDSRPAETAFKSVSQTVLTCFLHETFIFLSSLYLFPVFFSFLLIYSFFFSFFLQCSFLRSTTYKTKSKENYRCQHIFFLSLPDWLKELFLLFPECWCYPACCFLNFVLFFPLIGGVRIVTRETTKELRYKSLKHNCRRRRKNSRNIIY